MSPTCLQKCVTGYPQCPLHGWDSNKPSQEVFGHGLPICFFLALSQIAGLIVTWAPLGKRHLLEQIKTPRQDFLRIFTLWLFVFLMAHPLEWRLASSQLAGKMWRQCPSAHSGHSDTPCTSWNTIIVGDHILAHSSLKCYIQIIQKVNCFWWWPINATYKILLSLRW